MSKPIVLLDVDEVLADFVGRILDEVRNVTGRDYFRAQVTGWDICEALGLSAEERAAVLSKPKEEGFCYSLEPIVGAIEGVKALREFADVRAVTSPYKSKTWASERETWLCDLFGFERDHVVQTPGKDIVFGDVLVDDKLETCQVWSKRWRESTSILFSAPWNHHRGWESAGGEYTLGWNHRGLNFVYPTLVDLIKRCCP